jgi:hypothetical protein
MRGDNEVELRQFTEVLEVYRDKVPGAQAKTYRVHITLRFLHLAVGARAMVAAVWIKM